MTEPTIDRATMGKLSRTLAFIRGPDDPTTVALKLASESGTAKDIKAARTLFLRLKSSERQAALTMLKDD